MNRLATLLNYFGKKKILESYCGEYFECEAEEEMFESYFTGTNVT